MLDSKQHNVGVWRKSSLEVRDWRGEGAGKYDFRKPRVLFYERSLQFPLMTTLDFFSFPEIFLFKFADSAIILINRKL